MLRNRRDETCAVGAEYGARNIRLLGSVARGEDGQARWKPVLEASTRLRLPALPEVAASLQILVPPHLAPGIPLVEQCAGRGCGGGRRDSGARAIRGSR
jgi:hypothetical protein